MSSYYTTAQLEAMRKEQLRRELAENIKNLREQLRTTRANDVHIEKGENINISVFMTDDAIGGYSKDHTIKTDAIIKEGDGKKTKRDELDFSDLLCSTYKKPTKLEMELDSWLNKIDERVIISEKDVRDRARLLAELAKSVNDESIDIEDKIKSVKMRVTSYLQGAAQITKEDKEEMISAYYEYCALCEMLEMNPIERFPYRINEEIARMQMVLEKRKQDEYIMEVVGSVLEELGCHAGDTAVLDHTAGQLFSVEGHPFCDVFVGNDGSGIMFEPVGESKAVSLEKQRQIEKSANSICSLYAVLEEKAAERGVVLNRVYMEPSQIGEMCVQTDITERAEKKKQRKNIAQNQRTMKMEE